jgi:hypothetical protein
VSKHGDLIERPHHDHDRGQSAKSCGHGERVDAGLAFATINAPRLTTAEADIADQVTDEGARPDQPDNGDEEE